MPSWKKVIISGSDASLNSLNISTALTASGLNYPTADGSNGQAIVTDGSGSLSFASIVTGTGATTKLLQTTPSDTWTFNHNLSEKYPVITIYDDSDNVIVPLNIEALNSGSVEVTFSTARTGTAVAVVGGSTESSSYALTASYVNPLRQEVQITGSLNVQGSVTATEFHTEFVSASIIYQSGSTKFGDTSDDTHQITGSLHLTGSFSIDGTLDIETANISYQENIDVDSLGTEVIATVSATNYTAAFFDYVVKNGTNVRAGTVTITHDGTLVEYVDTSTQDLGNTTGVVLSGDLLGGNIRLLANTTTDNWSIKTLVRAI